MKLDNFLNYLVDENIKFLYNERIKNEDENSNSWNNIRLCQSWIGSDAPL